ncbi:MAG TPA: PASTA domain-containing protein [Bacteroidales bacterium]|jgi:beta-lactam-binding protein with PASTA domain|nr:PASTA domain-containing protein [Bacteroidales bacterium]OQB60695.1 MAG: Serine/threonine-protein kinase PK-1 [Bacteroidetes bacterium ADurb.Bin145]NMD03891.1 PASTA domain-containing protein [Bacteroidales bacterium]HOU01398.1 PASTA domain-containing protein [Bacteroidales bacterium]HQG62100.1 PASTA domain-containing protein [Bacteroidales bacterium]
MKFKEFILSKLFLKHLGLAVSIFIGFVLLMLLWLNIYTRHGQARPVPDFFGLSLQQTDSLARKTRMRYKIVDSIFTSRVPRGCIAEQNPKPGFKVKKWRNISLIINAFRPEMIAMPNLVDLPLNQAMAMIQNAGLEMGTLSYKPDLSINMVLSQKFGGREIAEGDSIQKGSVIDLVLGKGLSNQRTIVPDLIGLTLEPAREKILSSSLNLGTYIYDNTIVTREDSINAFVYKQNPEFNEESTLQLGSSIYLWLTVDSLKLPVDSTLIMLPDSLPVPEIIQGPEI